MKIIYKITFLAKTNLGKSAIILIFLMPIFFYLGSSFVNFYKSIPAGKTIPQDIITRPGVALSMLTGFISGIAAFFTGLISIIRKKDYSLLVFLSTILGFLMLLWILAEIIFPH